MKLTYRHKPRHRVSIFEYIFLKARDVFLAALPAERGPMASPVKTAFVVGCGHSGTTLLASRIARSPEIYLHPEETGLFQPAFGDHFSRKMLSILLSAAEQSGASYLLEKTPKHVQCVGTIERYFPEAKILAISRNPLDNCASLFKRFGDLDLCIERWNMDNRALAALVEVNKALHVRYENLVSSPGEELARIFEYLELPWDAAFLDGGESAYERSGPKNANQKIRFAQIGKEIAVNVGTYVNVLSEVQVAEVRWRTKPIAERIGYI